MTRYLIAAALLASASPALAGPLERDYRIERAQQAARNWEHAYLALSAIDAAETIYALDHDLAEEANPLLGKHPSTAKIIAVKVAVGAAHYALFTYANDRNPKSALRFAQVSAIMQGGVVGLNLRVVFK